MTTSLKDVLTHKLSALNGYAETCRYPYVGFGIFGVITYPLFYFIWLFVSPTGYENPYLRIAAVLICIPLLFHHKWPRRLLFFLPLYWYAALWFCLPFLFTFLLLKNNLSETGLFNTMTILVLMILLLDIKALLVLLVTGILGGFLAFVLSPHAPLILPHHYVAIAITYFSVIFFGAFFAHRKEVIHAETLRTTKLLGASIAHELRTPLGAIASGIHGISKYLPVLVESYETAKKSGVTLPHISAPQYHSLAPICDNMAAEVQAAFTFINMLLTKTKFLEEKRLVELKPCNMLSSITESLARYPFARDEKQKVEFQQSKTHDFIFMGDTDLFVHILFNLFKNALYYIKAKGSGSITLWIDQTEENWNKVHFKDTGPGMSSAVQDKIFDRFFTRTPHGTGIGLAFCKIAMETMKGHIECYSEEGEYTEFVLFFPVVQNEDEKMGKRRNIL